MKLQFSSTLTSVAISLLFLSACSADNSAKMTTTDEARLTFDWLLNMPKLRKSHETMVTLVD